MEGLEPPRLAAPDPKSGAATNYATSAFSVISFSFDGVAPSAILKERKFIDYSEIEKSDFVLN